MSRFSLKVNGESRTVDADPDCPLLYVLHDEEFRNPRFGCGLGQCGACTVIIGGRAVRSCQTPVRTAAGRDVTTLEGLGAPARPDRVQQAFIDAQAFQCGYCLNGWVMTTKALLDRNPRPSEAQIRAAFDGLVCRCGSHVRILEAVRTLAGPGRERRADAGRDPRDTAGRDPQSGPGEGSV